MKYKSKRLITPSKRSDQRAIMHNDTQACSAEISLFKCRRSCPYKHFMTYSDLKRALTDIKMVQSTSRKNMQDSIWN